MAQRQLAARTTTDIVLPDERKADMWKAGADVASGALNIKMKIDAAKMNDFVADANLQAMKATKDWRVANESSPFDENAVRSLNEQYSRIFSQYEGKVGFLSKGQWQQTASKMTKQWQADNFQWGVQREIKNAEISINSSIKKDMALYQSIGQTGDINKAVSSARDRLTELQNTVSGVIGEESFKRLTQDYEADAIKSFILGKAETDPEGAIVLLSDKKIADNIGEDKVRLLSNFALRQKKVFDMQERNQMISREMEVFGSIANQTISDIVSVTALASDGIIRPQAAEAYVAYLTNPDIDFNVKDDGFTAYADALFEIGDKQGINDLLIEALHGRDGRLNPTRLDKLIKIASMRASAMPEDSSDVAGKKTKKKEINNSTDALFANLMNWAANAEFTEEQKAILVEDFVDVVSENDAQPDMLFDDIIKKCIIRNNPEVASLPNVPNMVITKNNTIRFIFPKENALVPNRIYNPKTGMFENNAETKK